MKKRLIPLLLIITLVIPALAVPVNAAGTYGSVPIVTRYADVDYLADQLLSEIPTAGKNHVEQIRAVYDWIIRHCNRYDWDGTKYYDEQAVEAAAPSYGNSMEQRIFQGNAVCRLEMEPYWNIDNGGDYSFDSDYVVAYKARQMMLKRTGDCVDYSALFTVLLGHLGFDSRMIAGSFINSNGTRVSHKWNYVLVDGRYYWFDIRMDHALYVRKGKIPYTYFMIEDTHVWEKTHEWDHNYSDLLAANAGTVVNMYNQAIQSAAGTASYEDVDTNDGSLYNFWKVNDYIDGQFLDVRSGDWYADNVRTAYEYGLLLGNDNGRFGVGDNLTIGQTLAIADRLHNRYYGGSGFFIQRDPWYQVYVDYAVKYGIIRQGQYDPLATATRAQFAEILSAAMPEEALPAINQISRIPDVSYSTPYAGAVLRLYKAGILTGNDASGTFEPNTPIKREQVAAMATRFADISLRKELSLR